MKLLRPINHVLYNTCSDWTVLVATSPLGKDWYILPVKFYERNKPTWLHLKKSNSTLRHLVDGLIEQLEGDTSASQSSEMKTPVIG